MQLSSAIIGLLIYYLYIALVGKGCRSLNLPRALAFRVGVAASLLLAMITLALVSVYYGRLMLINDDLLVTVFCMLVLGLLGGLRCRDQVAKLSMDDNQ